MRYYWTVSRFVFQQHRAPTLNVTADVTQLGKPTAHRSVHQETAVSVVPSVSFSSSKVTLILVCYLVGKH